ncbi:hypothetical protein SteCoe_36873 [Stentor coeruleus]|uniref:Uncharacterized protein n=1 Tax=Stentor coeruleus TaxID=5963 RepID=A0A1R2AP90_9CILI|nr:hypothetical protein SteCoe_36873 [Stentor coeruleus]
MNVASESSTLDLDRKNEVVMSKANKAVEEIEKAWKYIQVESKLFLSNKYYETLNNFSGQVACINFSPDGKFFVSGCGKYIKIWNLADKKEEVIFDSGNYQLWSVIFSPDGKLILSGGKINSLKYGSLPKKN